MSRIFRLAILALSCLPPVLSSLCAAQPEPGTPFAYTRPSGAELLSLIVAAACSSGNAETPADLAAEARALVHQLHTYDLDSPPHKTDTSTDFEEVQWSFMAMTYTGLALVELAEKGVVERDWATREVAWVLAALRRPAVSGFMTRFFGDPFPAEGLAKKAAVVVHGHYLYLGLHARKRLDLQAEDAHLCRAAEVLLRDYGAARVLPSYTGMFCVCDNLPAQAALRLYDGAFGGGRGAAEAALFLAEVKARYLDPDTGLICTYVDPVQRRPLDGPRGIGTMYEAIFLPEIDPGFAASQWRLARKHLIRPLGSVLERQLRGTPGVAFLGAGGLGKHRVSLEFPDTPRLSWAQKNRSDIDSGPVVFGIGTAACGFLPAAAARNGDLETAASSAELARKLGGPVRVGDRLYYRNFFHESGQTMQLFGKALALPAPQERPPRKP